MIDELLTPREREVIKLIALGFSNKEITEKLYISDSTRQTHYMSIMQKLNVSHDKKFDMSVKRLRVALLYLKEHKELINEIGF